MIRPIKSNKLDTDFIEFGKKCGTDIIQRYVERKEKEIQNLGIVEDYVQHGWKKVRDRVTEIMIPEMVAIVETIWRCAYRDSEN